MRGAMIIFIAMVAIGIVIYAIDLLYYRRKKGYGPYLRQKTDENSAALSANNSSIPTAGDANTSIPVSADRGSDGSGEVCCGMHTVCEKTNLSPLSGEIVYYDDEELDRFRGREPESYTPEETEEFRDVLMTLLPEDVAGWSRSIQVRQIALPVEVRDELLLIVGELRQGGQ